jgi:hypothetical protein
MSLQIHFRCEDDKFLFLALSVQTWVMISPEMLLKRVVVNIVMGLPRILTITKEAPLMLVATMLIQFVSIVETLTAKSTQRVSLEAGLVNSTGAIIAVAHMNFKLLVGEKFVLVGKHFLVASTQIAHLLVMRTSNMAVEIWPTKAGEIALCIRTIIP